LTGESVNYSAGLGFSGYDEEGRSKWDLLDNAEVYLVEVVKRCPIGYNDKILFFPLRLWLVGHMTNS